MVNAHRRLSLHIVKWINCFLSKHLLNKLLSFVGEMHRCYSGLYQQNCGCEPTDQRNCKIPVSIFTLSCFFHCFGHAILAYFLDSSSLRPSFGFPLGPSLTYNSALPALCWALMLMHLPLLTPHPSSTLRSLMVRNTFPWFLHIQHPEQGLKPGRHHWTLTELMSLIATLIGETSLTTTFSDVDLV